MQIIDGSQLSNFKTTAIELGKSKQTDGNPSKTYAVLFVKNVKDRVSRARHILIWEDDEPSIIEILKKYRAKEANKNGRYLVDLKELKNSDDFEEVEDLFKFSGMKTMKYKLRKGLCYLNDVNGKRVLKKQDNTPIIRSEITILIRIDNITEINGATEINYFDGMDPSTVGERMENTFYKEAYVATTPATPAVTEEEADETDEATPF